MTAQSASAHIPSLIHQTYRSKSVPEDIERNIAHLKAQNPTFEYHLYDDAEILDFIRDEYEASTLAAYSRIRPEYGAAKADFFRYLLLYKKGGAYLDLKSTTSRPLAQTIRPDDRYLLAHWPNRPGETYQDWGTDSAAFPSLPAGEFQQWHIIAAPGHPFLAAVIEAVHRHIHDYTPWRYGVGPMGTLQTTGPLCYTRAILPILNKHPHRTVRTHEEIGLAYSIFDKPTDHRALGPSHYRLQTAPVVDPAGFVSSALFRGYIQAERVRRKVSRLIGR